MSQICLEGALVAPFFIASTMEIPLTTLQLRTIVREAAELGAIIALVRTGKLPSYLNARPTGAMAAAPSSNCWPKASWAYAATAITALPGVSTG